MSFKISQLECLEGAYQTWLKGLERSFSVKINPEKDCELRECFVNSLGGFMEVVEQSDADSGAFIDEVYGDDILDYIIGPEEDVGDGDSETADAEWLASAGMGTDEDYGEY